VHAAINGWFVIKHVLKTLRLRLTEEETNLWKEKFGFYSKVEFGALRDVFEWQDIEPGGELIAAGVCSPNLMFLTKGDALVVNKQGVDLAMISTRQWLGEVALLTLLILLTLLTLLTL
jgi:hypothetical protein